MNKILIASAATLLCVALLSNVSCGPKPSSDPGNATQNGTGTGGSGSGTNGGDAGTHSP